MHYSIFCICHLIFTTNLTEDAIIITVIEIAILQLRKQAQRGKGTCPKSHSCGTPVLRLEPRPSGCRVLALTALFPTSTVYTLVDLLYMS